ncbi:hypothetical protein SAMN05421553_0381 [Pseudomonas anguilliseptica]|uniref:Uncharacterized protein n=1 Tax=Pseudomonas anguilliseptica TaxID=53406 RepID=A0A1H4Q192_PSEAG|nr:hypothetical protein SAMN05421553_0381 [Pseudomonas anguilliseptica]
MVQQQEQGLADVAQRTFRSYLTFKPLTRKQGKAINKLRDFIGFTAFSTLQGAEVDRALITNTIRSYLHVDSLSVIEHMKPDFNDQFTDADDLNQQLEQFYSLSQKVKEAFATVGMLDTATLSRISNNEKAESFKQTYMQDLSCSEYLNYDFSDYNIQVEEDYIHRPTHSPTWLPF